MGSRFGPWEATPARFVWSTRRPGTADDAVVG